MLVDFQSKVVAEWSDQISECVAALELVVVDPILDKVKSALLENWANELNCFEGVQFDFLQQNLEILDDWLRLSWLCRSVLEFLNGFLSSKANAVSDDSGRALVVSLDESFVEFLFKEFFSSRKFAVSSESDSNLNVVWNVLALVHDVWDKSVRVAAKSNDRTFLVDDEHTVRFSVSCSDEDWVVAEFTLADNGASGNFVNEVVTEFGDDIQDAKLGRDLHINWEIVGFFRRKGNFSVCFELCFSFSRWSYRDFKQVLGPRKS